VQHRNQLRVRDCLPVKSGSLHEESRQHKLQLTSLMTLTINTFATFAGSFTFAEGKQLSIEQVQGESDASTVPSATAHVLSNHDV